MSVNPIGGITNVSSLLQPSAAQIASAQGTVPGSATATAAQTTPTADAAQAWEEAMRAAMGDVSSSNHSSSDPLSALATQNAAAQSAATLSATPSATTQTAAAPAASLATPSGGAPLTTAASPTGVTSSVTGVTSPATGVTAPASGVTTPATGSAAQTALSPQALAALVSGSSSATSNPLITSLSAPSADSAPAPPVSSGDASSYI